MEGPRNVKQLHAMLGHTGYYRKIIKAYTQITAPMEKLLKKDVTFYWNEECYRNLDVLKEKMVTAPILVFLNWKNECHVHMDASFIVLGAVIIEAGEGEMDNHIALEYDFEFVVKLGRLNAGPDHLSRIETAKEPSNLEKGMLDAQRFAICVVDTHFSNIIHFLTIGMALEGYTSQQNKELVVSVTDFSIIARNLYKMGANEILQRHVPEFEHDSIFTEAHGGAAGGHYGGKSTVQKILYAGLWWPTLHNNSKAYCKACDACQRTGKPSRRDEVLLHPQVSLQAFEKWAINFIGPLHPPRKKTSMLYIITTRKYLTRCVEAQRVMDYTRATTKKFLFEHVLTRFGCPKVLMSDRGTHFLNETISTLTEVF
eukprot:PITA_14900